MCLTNGAFQENCYLVADTETKEAVMIDPGEEVDLFFRRLETEAWELKEIWLTHAHIDHIAGLAEAVRRKPVPIYLHPADRRMYDGVSMQGAAFGMSVETPPPPDFELAHGDTVRIGRFEFGVVHVPGHSPGSVAFLGGKIAIVGDVLFAGSVGRVDLPGGDGPTLLHSIETQLMPLDDDVVVFAGHGPATTIGQERVGNPFVTGAYPLA